MRDILLIKSKRANISLIAHDKIRRKNYLLARHCLLVDNFPKVILKKSSWLHIIEIFSFIHLAAKIQVWTLRVALVFKIASVPTEFSKGRVKSFTTVEARYHKFATYEGVKYFIHPAGQMLFF